MAIMSTHSFQIPKIRHSSPFVSSSVGVSSSPLSVNHVCGTQLFSLSSLVDELTSSDSSSSSSAKTVFVGGKGGVGKTSISSALAVTLASSFEHDVKVLVVSTDPAHSLGDALDVDLKSAASSGGPIQMTDPLTMGNLYACEVDPEAALDSFREALEAFDIQTLSQSLGVSVEMLQGFGLQDVSTLLNNPPPGLDELVALSNVLDGDNAKDFDLVIVDTAPTGHTLRMLALPQFLDGFLVKILELRQKLSGLAKTLQAFLGNNEAEARANTVDDAIRKLQDFQQKMTQLRQRLSDDNQTNFIIVSIPTKLSVNESKRLMADLQSQGISVTNIVMNQCISSYNNNDNDGSSNAMIQYYQRRQAGQQKWIDNLQTAIDDVSQSDEYKSNNGQSSSSSSIQLTKVPFFDVELIGVPALAYIGKSTFVDNPNYEYLLNTDTAEDKKDCQFIICGGKGGVGKTTTSSSLAVTMAAEGNNVALISTDPAHSLGDAFDIDFRGGELIDVPLIGVPPTDGTLSVMEIDPAMALGQFKGLVDDLVGAAGTDSESGGIGKTLRDLGEIFDTLPAGTDEVVALAKVVKLVKEGNFDRIVLDTAPTGHTLRMLSTPSFIADLIDKLLAIAQKLNSNSMVKMLMAGATSGEDMESAAAAAKSALLSFQFQMYDLEDLFANPDQTEFLVVTIPTELAVRESIRLLNDLTFEAPDMPIKVRNVVVNQVLNEGGDDVESFVQRVSHSQKCSIEDLKSAAAAAPNPPTITEVPYLDTEPRGVFGLKALSMELVKEDQLQ